MSTADLSIRSSAKDFIHLNIRRGFRLRGAASLALLHSKESMLRGTTMALTATQSPPVIALQARTYEDLLALPDDGHRYELIFGEIVMSPSPKTKHQRALGNLFGQIDRFTREHSLGDVFFAPLDVKLSPYDAVQPDLFFVCRERDEIVTFVALENRMRFIRGLREAPRTPPVHANTPTR
jgi:hypothetical protein